MDPFYLTILTVGIIFVVWAITIDSNPRGRK